jgi:4-hydroxy-tetrahydrodipicolinate reductase
MADVIEEAGGKRPEIAVFRGGEVVGEHTALYLGPSERIEITHRASSRRVFADGAVRAAVWLCGRGPGMYEMKDVIG